MKKAYRNDSAQEIHKLIMTTIRAENIEKFNECLNKLKKLLENVDKITEGFSQASINQYTHFHDVLHLPFQVHKDDRELAKIISCQLFNYLSEICKKRLTKEQQKYILLTFSTDNFSILADALHNNRETQVIFNIINWIKEILVPREQAVILDSYNKGGFTILQEALKSEDNKVTIEIIDWIKNILDFKQQQTMLTLIPTNGHDVLHEAMNNQSDEIKFKIIHWIKQVLPTDAQRIIIIKYDGNVLRHCIRNSNDEKIVIEIINWIRGTKHTMPLLTIEEQIAILNPISTDGYNLLHEAFVNKPDILLEIIHWMKNVLPIENQKVIIKSVTTTGFTILRQTIKNTKDKNVAIEIIDWIRSTKYTKPLLTIEEQIAILVPVSPDTFNLLHETFIHKPDIAFEIIDWMEKVLPPKNQIAILESLNANGFSILHEALTNTPEVANKVIDWTKKILTPQAQSAIVKSITAQGFTVLHGVLKDGNDRIAFKMIDWIRGTKHERPLLTIEEQITMLKSLNLNGFSILHEAFSNKPPVALDIIHWMKKILPIDDQKIVANSITRYGFTVLHGALINGNDKVIFELIDWICGIEGTEGLLTIEEQRTLLRSIADNNRSILSLALATNKPVVTLRIIELMQTVLIPEDQRAIVKFTSANGFNLLHDTFKNTLDEEVVIAITNWIRGAERIKAPLTIEDQKNLLKSVTKNNFTTLHQALTNTPFVAREVITWMQEILNKEEQKTIVNCITIDGFTILHGALMNGNNKVVSEIIKWMENILSTESLKKLVLTQTKAGFNLLHSATKTNNHEIFDAVINFLNKLYQDESQRIISDFANQKTKNGIRPNSKNKEIEKFLQPYRNKKENITFGYGLHKRKQEHGSLFEETTSSQERKPKRAVVYKATYK